MRPDDSDQNSLERRADELASGKLVDWNSAALEAGSEDERRWLGNLRVVEQVARTARQEFGGGDATLDLGGTPVEGITALSPGDTPTLRSWGHLNLLEKIGRGGFGEVHRAWDTRLNRAVALKLLHAAGVDEQSLLDEAQLLARVEHPNVARVYGVEKHDGRVGIWMELIEGVDLQSLLKESGPFAPQLAIRAALDVTAALTALHAGGVLHRDVKPQNIVQATDGRFVLMDLGAGRKRRLEGDESGAVVSGTPRFVAPELFLQQSAANPRSEVYALGVTLYHLLSGAFPVDGTIAELHERHRQRVSRPLFDAAPQLSPAICAVVDRAVSVESAERFGDAAEFATALEALLEPAQSQKKSRRWGATWFVAALLIVAAGIVWIQRQPTVEIPLTAEVQMGNLTSSGWAPLALNAPIGTQDQVQLTIQLSRSAHVYLLNRDAAGNTVVLFPMEGGELQNPLPAGRPLVIPGIVAGERKGWAFSTVAGAEDFLVIASEAALEEFEGELLNFASVDVGGGLTVQPLNGSSTLR